MPACIKQAELVPVDEAHRVDSIQSQHHLSSVKACPFLWNIIVAHQIHQVTTRHVLHHHVEVAVILECKKELQKKKSSEMKSTKKNSQLPRSIPVT